MIKLLKPIQDRHRNAKVVFYCNHFNTASSIFDGLDSAGIQYLHSYISETSTIPNKQSLINTFASDSSHSVLVLDSSIPLEEYNLTWANHVILSEPLPTFAAEHSAIQNVYRSGQKQAVYVYQVFLSNTVEEKLSKIRDHSQI